VAAETPSDCSNKLETDVAEAREEVRQMVADSTSGCLDLDHAGGTSGCLNQVHAQDEVRAGSIECFIEDQAFLRSAPRHPPPPLFHQQVVPLSQSSCVSPVEITDGREGGRGAKSSVREKAWPSINYQYFDTLWVQVIHGVLRRAILLSESLSADVEKKWWNQREKVKRRAKK
jgi:hypothetical protein